VKEGEGKNSIVLLELHQAYYTFYIDVKDDGFKQSDADLWEL
jgi:hypothetical protein